MCIRRICRWRLDSNLLPGAPTCPTAGVAACGLPGLGANNLPTNGLPFQDWGAPACAVNPGLCFADPTHVILQNNVYSSAASALYQGGIFELKKNFSNHFMILANYTYSRATDNTTDFNSDYSPFNATCLRCDYSLSGLDQRNKVVIAGVLSESLGQVGSLRRLPVGTGFQLQQRPSVQSSRPVRTSTATVISQMTALRGVGRNTGDQVRATRT